MVLVTIFLFAVGLLFLVKGADFLIEGSSKIAERLGISKLVVGLTIVAFGTSLPELSVSLISALQGNADISIGNIVGSNIINIGFILGLSVIIFPIAIHMAAILREIPILIFISLIFFLLSFDSFFGFPYNFLLIFDGAILLLIFLYFLHYVLKVAKKQRSLPEQLKEAGEKIKGFFIKKEPYKRLIFFILTGLGGTIIGGKILVDSASEIARLAGVNDAIIGLTLVAIGTSLPELFTNVMASLKKHSEIAIGNIVGSNIFNIGFILGISSLITPINISAKFFTDYLFMLFYAVILLPLAFSRRNLSRLEGFFMLAVYVFYIITLSANLPP